MGPDYLSMFTPQNCHVENTLSLYSSIPQTNTFSSTNHSLKCFTYLNHSDEFKELYSKICIEKKAFSEADSGIHPHFVISRIFRPQANKHINVLDQTFQIPLEPEKLIQQGLPWPKDILSHLYCLIERSQLELFKNNWINYPAIFKGKVTVYEGHSKAIDLFELVIQPPNKAYLLLARSKVKQSNLEELDDQIEKHAIVGSYKKVYQAFSLHKLKKVVFAESRRNHHINRDKNKINLYETREVDYLKKLSNDFHFPKIEEIYYRHHVCKNTYFFCSQVMIMKFYPYNLLQLVQLRNNNEQEFSSSIKTAISISLLECIQILHDTYHFVHRDIKPENLLLSEKGVVLIDFGFMCEANDKIALTQFPGTGDYTPPEILLQNQYLKPNMEKIGFFHDSWSVACVLWLLWEKKIYSWRNNFEEELWYEENEKINSSEKSDEESIRKKEQEIAKKIIEKIARKIEKFDRQPPSDTQSISFLLWNMLRLDPKNRWTIGQALTFLKDYKEKCLID